MNETTIRIEWNRGKSYLEMDLSMILPAAPTNMNRIIETICLADCDQWEVYAAQINDYIAAQVLDLTVKRGTLDKKRQQKQIADINRQIKRLTANSAALAKRFEVEAVSDQTTADIPKMKKAVVECLQKDPDCSYKNIVTECDGFTFNYKGFRFDICKDRPAHWKILLHGTGVQAADCKNKTDAYMAITDELISFLNSDKGRENVQAARNDYLKAKGMEPEAETETQEAAQEAQEGENMNTEEKQVQEVKTDVQATAAAEKKDAFAEVIDVSTLTPENIGGYMTALTMGLMQRKDNNAIILLAALDAQAVTPAELLAYLQTGRMPAVHTFDAWKQAGYTVRKGEHAAFTARIWKYNGKSKTLTAAEAEEMNRASVLADTQYKEGDTIESGDFIRKEAYFFKASQVDKTPEPAALPELPADVKQETRRGCEWISGNTRPIKEALKAAGFRWSKKNSAWYRKAA